MASLSLLWRWQLSLDPFTQDTATSHSLLANLLPAPLKSQASLSPPGLKPYSRSHGLPSSHILSVCTMIQISNPIPSKILTFTFFFYTRSRDRTQGLTCYTRAPLLRRTPKPAFTHLYFVLTKTSTTQTLFKMVDHWMFSSLCTSLYLCSHQD